MNTTIARVKDKARSIQTTMKGRALSPPPPTGTTMAHPTVASPHLYSNQQQHHNHHHHHQQPLQQHDRHQTQQQQQQQQQQDGCLDDLDDEFERYKLIDRVRFKLFMSEFLGTFVFVYLGQSALASFELTGTQNDTLTRQLATILSQGLAYLFATLLALSLSGAHLNPAYTFASAVFGYMSWSRAMGYFLAQYSGAFLASIFLHATYCDKLAHRHMEGLLAGPNASLRAHGNILSTGKLFSSYPPTEVSLTQLTISYTLATAHLMLLLLAVNESKLLRVARSLKPLYLGAALSLVLAAFSANGGPVWNPAQDFSPRLYIALFGWGSAAFNLYNFKYWWLCGLVAPHLGALLGFAAYRLFDHLRSIPHVEHHSPYHRQAHLQSQHRHHDDEHGYSRGIGQDNEDF